MLPSIYEPNIQYLAYRLALVWAFWQIATSIIEISQTKGLQESWLYFQERLGQFLNQCTPARISRRSSCTLQIGFWHWRPGIFGLIHELGSRSMWRCTRLLLLSAKFSGYQCHLLYSFKSRWSSSSNCLRLSPELKDLLFGFQDSSHWKLSFLSPGSVSSMIFLSKNCNWFSSFMISNCIFNRTREFNSPKRRRRKKSLSEAMNLQKFGYPKYL